MEGGREQRLHLRPNYLDRLRLPRRIESLTFARLYRQHDRSCQSHQAARPLWPDESVANFGTYRNRRNSTRLSIDAAPRWDNREVRVVYYTNGDEAEIFLNGSKIGERKSFDPGSDIIHWDIDFEAGELKVVSFRDGEAAASETIEASLTSPDLEPAKVLLRIGE